MVEEYKYLGLEFGVVGARGRWNSAVTRMLERARAQANQLLWACRRTHILRPDVMLHLWRCLIRPIIEYGAPVWSVALSDSMAHELETLQCEYLRACIGCSRSSQAFIRQEFGLESLVARRDKLVLRYWYHLNHLPENRLLSWVVMNRFRQVNAGAGRLSWCAGVRNLLLKYRIGQEWLSLSASEFSSRISTLTSDYSRESDVQQLSGQLWFDLAGDDIGLVRSYLVGRCSMEACSIKARLRAGVLPLMVVLGQQLGWPVCMRNCPVCHSSDVEDVRHFLLDCPAYRCERQLLYKKLTDAKLWRCAELWNSSSELDRLSLVLSSWSRDFVEAEHFIQFFLLAIFNKRFCGHLSVQRADGVRRLICRRNE